MWAERTPEKTLRGSGEGLVAYVEAASAREPTPAPPRAPVPALDELPEEENEPAIDAVPASQPPTAAGTAGSIVRNISGDIVGFTDANRIKLLAITEDVPHEAAQQVLMADGYDPIREVGDSVLMGLDLHRDMARRLESEEGVVARSARYLLYGVVPILLVLSLLLGAKGARWSLTVPHKRDALRVFAKALCTRLATLEQRQARPVLDPTAVWIFRLFMVALIAWFLLVLLTGGVPTGFLWLVPFILVGAVVVWARLWRDQRALVATVARSMQLHGFTDEVIGQFARENAALINEGAERIVTPYYGMGSSSARAVNERLMRLWTDIMGREPQELAHILERQKQAALSLLREANTVGSKLADEEGTLKSNPGDPRVPNAGPAFGLIRKGYRGSGTIKGTEGGEDAELTSRPAIVKFVVMVIDALHTWLDDKMLANKAKRLASAVQQRRLLGQSLQDARTMGEDLESRAMQHALDRAELEARLAQLSAKKREIQRRSRESEAQAEEDFDHDYEDEVPNDELVEDNDDEVDHPEPSNHDDEGVDAPDPPDSAQPDDRAPSSDDGDTGGNEPPDRP